MQLDPTAIHFSRLHKYRRTIFFVQLIPLDARVVGRSVLRDSLEILERKLLRRDWLLNSLGQHLGRFSRDDFGSTLHANFTGCDLLKTHTRGELAFDLIRRAPEHVVPSLGVETRTSDGFPFHTSHVRDEKLDGIDDCARHLCRRRLHRHLRRLLQDFLFRRRRGRFDGARRRLDRRRRRLRREVNLEIPTPDRVDPLSSLFYVQRERDALRLRIEHQVYRSPHRKRAPHRLVALVILGVRRVQLARQHLPRPPRLFPHHPPVKRHLPRVRHPPRRRLQRDRHRVHSLRVRRSRRRARAPALALHRRLHASRARVPRVVPRRHRFTARRRSRSTVAPSPPRRRRASRRVVPRAIARRARARRASSPSRRGPRRRRARAIRRRAQSAHRRSRRASAPSAPSASHGAARRAVATARANGSQDPYALCAGKQSARVYDGHIQNADPRSLRSLCARRAAFILSRARAVRRFGSVHKEDAKRSD